jgi:hypothetical protein
MDSSRSYVILTQLEKEQHLNQDIITFDKNEWNLRSLISNKNRIKDRDYK